MNLFYIFVRTFPFWAIPLGIALITTAVRGKSGHKKKKILYISLGLILLGGSTVFLFMRGHVQAVPFVHDIFHGQR